VFVVKYKIYLYYCEISEYIFVVVVKYIFVVVVVKYKIYLFCFILKYFILNYKIFLVAVNY